VRGVQRDETQLALAHSRHQALNVFVRHQVVFLMTPPDHHIRVFEGRRVEALGLTEKHALRRPLL
jgi:hypothetical protein